MMTNFRATALGAMIGFVIAVASSCGGAAACKTCLDAAGKCVAEPNNRTDNSCGTAGVSCVDCKTRFGANSTCNTTTFLCSGAPTGGGTGTGTGGNTGTGGGTGTTTGGGTGTTGGGTGTTGGGTGSNQSVCAGGTVACGGCCSGTTCVGAATAGSSKTNCGLGGIACASCPGTQVCTAGVCGTPGTMTDGGPAGLVGRTCAADADCAGIPNGICKLTTAVPAAQNGTYPGGYCTRVCDTDNMCPTGSQCVGFSGGSEPLAFCTKNCRPPQSATSPDCRTGYACYGLSSGGMNLPDGACWLNPAPIVDAGTPSATVGLPCANDTACATPGNFDTLCFPGTLPDGGPSNFPGGYCTAACNDDSNCSADMSAACLTLGQAPNTFDACLKKCPQGEADGGQNSCRTGYQCLPVGGATFGVCF